jgi:hypothetical protein
MRTLSQTSKLISQTCKQVAKRYKPKPYSRDGENESNFLTLIHRYSYHNEVRPEQVFLVVRGYRMPKYQEQTKLEL